MGGMFQLRLVVFEISQKEYVSGFKIFLWFKIININFMLNV